MTQWFFHPLQDTSLDWAGKSSRWPPVWAAARTRCIFIRNLWCESEQRGGGGLGGDNKSCNWTVKTRGAVTSSVFDYYSLCLCLLCHSNCVTLLSYGVCVSCVVLRVTHRLEQCCVLTELLKMFQSTRAELSGTLQRAESTISEQASYMGKDNLQRLHTKV